MTKISQYCPEFPIASDNQTVFVIPRRAWDRIEKIALWQTVYNKEVNGIRLFFLLEKFVRVWSRRGLGRLNKTGDRVNLNMYNSPQFGVQPCSC